MAEPLICTECGREVRRTAGRDDVECGVSYHTIGAMTRVVCASCVLIALDGWKNVRLLAKIIEASGPFREFFPHGGDR
jgi:hypothetical protein